MKDESDDEEVQKKQVKKRDKKLENKNIDKKIVSISEKATCDATSDSNSMRKKIGGKDKKKRRERASLDESDDNSI